MKLAIARFILISSAIAVNNMAGISARTRARFWQIVEGLPSYKPGCESSGDELVPQSMSPSHIDALTASGRM
jgi:hypothetical protein